MVRILSLSIILAESALELIPKELHNNPIIVRSARKRNKRPSEMLLDISLHYKAMKSLPLWYKRGRPDIIHISLLNILSSPLNYEGMVNVYIHTFNNIVIFIDPKTRIPKNYNRFVGLIEQLLTIGRVPPDSDKPLMWIKSSSISDLVKDVGCSDVILMHEEGEFLSPYKLGKLIASKILSNENICIVVGGFQRGDFSEETMRIATKRISIYRKSLPTWIVVDRVIGGVEEVLGIYGKTHIS